MKNKISQFFWAFYIRLLSLSFIPNWIIDSSCKGILDLGCGQGLQMKTIKLRHRQTYSVGVDLFKPYIDKGKKEKIHNKYIFGDIRKISFKDKSFDVVMACQVLEHLSRKDAFALLNRMEKIAKKLVIISTPIGRVSYHTDDGNKLQKHKSFFYPDEFRKLGYRIIKVGGKQLFSEESGLIHKVKPSFLRKFIFVLDIFLTPYYLIAQSRVNYYFFAFKKMENNESY